MAKPALATHVAKAIASADTDGLKSALGKLIAARLKARQTRPTRPTVPLPKPTPQRRAPRRGTRGVRFYEPTGKGNYTRMGTWTHFMIDCIRRHTDTRSAQRECDSDLTYSGKRLDFNWAADQGYIDWK